MWAICIHRPASDVDGDSRRVDVVNQNLLRVSDADASLVGP